MLIREFSGIPGISALLIILILVYPELCVGGENRFLYTENKICIFIDQITFTA